MMMLQLRMEYELDSLLGNSFDLSVILYAVVMLISRYRRARHVCEGNGYAHKRSGAR